jgi:hypothetical protein
MAGTVAPNLRDTQWSFEFGPTPAYGSRTPPQGAGAGNSPVPESFPLSGLAPGTTVHYRLVATNLDGTSTGADQTFTTAKPAALVVFTGVRLRHLTVFVRGKFVVVPIFCPAGPCKGSIALRTAARVTAAAKKKRLLLGSARFTIASAKTKNVKVKLTRRARKLVARKRSIRTIATVKSSSAGQTKTLTRRVTVKLRKKERH